MAEQGSSEHDLSTEKSAPFAAAESNTALQPTPPHPAIVPEAVDQEAITAARHRLQAIPDTPSSEPGTRLAGGRHRAEAADGRPRVSDLTEQAASNSGPSTADHHRHDSPRHGGRHRKPGFVRSLVNKFTKREQTPATQPEQAIEHQDFIDHNRRLLEATGERGQYLTALYDFMATTDPRLKRIELKALPSTETSMPPLYAEFNQKNHTFSVNMRLDPDGLDLIAQKYQENPIAMELVAEKLGIAVEELTPELATAFGLVHEFGHALDYIAFEHNPAAYNQRKQADLQRMPIPGLNGTHRMDDPAVRAKIEERWEELSRRNGVSTFEELHAAQQRGHRTVMTSERVADDYATQIITAYRARNDQAA